MSPNTRVQILRFCKKVLPKLVWHKILEYHWVYRDITDTHICLPCGAKIPHKVYTKYYAITSWYTWCYDCYRQSRQTPRYKAYKKRVYEYKKLTRPKWLTKEQRKEMRDVYKSARYLSKLEGCELQVDHIEPLCGLDRCGLDVPWNLQVVSKEYNRYKSNYPIKN